MIVVYCGRQEHSTKTVNTRTIQHIRAAAAAAADIAWLFVDSMHGNNRAQTICMRKRVLFCHFHQQCVNNNNHRLMNSAPIAIDIDSSHILNFFFFTFTTEWCGNCTTPVFGWSWSWYRWRPQNRKYWIISTRKLLNSKTIFLCFSLVAAHHSLRAL